MKKPDDKEPAFKVVDRRRFDEEGHERAEGDENASSTKHDKCCDKEHGAHEAERPPINFSMFIQSLAHQAMMGLGIVPWPDTELIRKDLDMAKETIDLLKIIKEKTAGNLDKQEETLLNGIIYQLQIAFVDIAKEAKPGSGSSIIS